MDTPDSATHQLLVHRDGRIELTLDLRVYRLSAVQKAAYRVAAMCTAALGEIRGDSLPITILFPASMRREEADGVVRLFFQELLDQELREKVGEETSQLRTLLLAHAFSRTGLAPGG